MSPNQRAALLSAADTAEIAKEIVAAILSGMDEGRLGAAATRLDMASARLRGVVEKMREEAAAKTVAVPA